jgi:hypothetical protein
MKSYLKNCPPAASVELPEGEVSLDELFSISQTL